MERLKQTLQRIDGRGYKAYKDLQGSRYCFDHHTLIIDHVQGDPYAAPSRMRVVVPAEVAALPDACLATSDRCRATRDFLARAFRSAIRSLRVVDVDAGRQTVLDRSACLIESGSVELRFTVNLPAAGRRILGREAFNLLAERLPRAVSQTCLAGNLDLAALERHWAVVEDQASLRAALDEAGLVAFIANGAILPRRSGIDDQPMQEAIAWTAPESLQVTLQAPNAGQVSGLGIRRGITLIVGGGFHGKSTLLRAIEAGVYDHLPGDGREQVVTVASAIKIRAEDGRAVTAVDISPFINNLPYGKPTDSFTTDLASGSTSQAAALVEAIESGATAMLVDEDTSATNFMIRDQRMQALVAKQHEPITPFVDRIAELRDRLGASTVLVMGGSGDYFDHADTVIRMDAYRPIDVTTKAQEIAANQSSGRKQERQVELGTPRSRRLAPGSLSPETRPGRRKIQARGCDTLVFGRSDVDLRAIEQLVDPSQVRAIGWLLAHLATAADKWIEPRQLIESLLEHLHEGEWDLLSGRPDGDLARPRLAEVMAALNRLRGAHLQ
jgi:predicted ABC-class ATPase